MTDIFELFKQIEQARQAPPEAVSFIIAGLGNPGDKYAHNRHNLGFMTVDYIQQKNNFKVNRLKFKSLCGTAVFGGATVLFMKPQTFMNNSGEAVREAADFYKIPPERILVIHDDLALEPGTMRVKRKGSDGGHNGIKSIIAHLGTQSFPRIKIGIGEPKSGWEVADWVCSDPLPEAREPTYKCIEAALPCAELIVSGKVDEAMNGYNRSFAEENKTDA